MAAQRLIVVILAASLAGVGDRSSPSWDAVYEQSIQSLNRADFESARKGAESGYRAFCGHAPSRQCSRFRLLLAESLIELDRIQEALPLLEVTAPTPGDEARRFADLAMLHFRRHETDPAQQALTKARSAATSYPRDLTGKIELIGGMMQLQSDHTSDAEGSFRQALAAVEGSGSLIESYTLTDLGFLNLRLFRYDEALYWYGRARELAQRGGMQRALSVALGNIGAAYLNLGDFDQAIKNLQDAVKIAVDLKDRVYEIPALVLLGEAWSRTGDLDKAAECYQKARSLGNPDRDRWLANVLDDLSKIELQKGDIASAEDLNLKAMAIARQMESSQALFTHRIQSAAIDAARHQYAAAEKTYIDVLGASRDAGDPVAAFRCNAGLASLYRETGSASRAEREYRAAAAVIDEEHSKLVRDESKFSFISNMVEFYRDYVDFLFGRGDAGGAFRVAQSSRARVLEEKLHRDGDDRPSADAKSLEQEARNSGAVFLSYWLAKRSLLWVIDSTGLHSFELPAEAEIGAHVDAYNHAIQRRDNPVETGNQAGHWLFDNLMGAHYRVPENSHVVIEPDGVLHQLNFESLPAGDGSHYLIEDATISVAPSLALLQRSKYVPARRLLVFGDPGYEGTEFQRLSNVKAELEAVESHFPKPEIYVRSAATPAAYRSSRPETYSTMHFAAHAIANRESPLDSAIVLAGPAGSRKLYARDILQQPLTADLVTLSACQTAGSRTYYGEGLTGFSWAFLSAGARNVVAGLWDVDDRATAALMKSFYDQLAEGLPPVSALREAKLDLLRSGGAYRKPLYWAAFEIFTKALYQ